MPQSPRDKPKYRSYSSGVDWPARGSGIWELAGIETDDCGRTIVAADASARVQRGIDPRSTTGPSPTAALSCAPSPTDRNYVCDGNRSRLRCQGSEGVAARLVCCVTDMKRYE